MTFPPQLCKLFFLSSLRLMLAVLFVSLCPHSLRAEDTDAAESAADKAWKALKHARETPPEPLKQLPDRMYTQDEIRNHYTMVAEQAGAVADSAKQFYTQFPDHPQAAEARNIYFDMLHTAVGYSSTNKIAELEAVTAERLKDPKLDEAARLQLSLHLLHSAISGRKYQSDDAMRAELEKRARQLAKDYPGHPDGYNYLLNIARSAAPEKSAALAREILAGSNDVNIKNECQGLINRAAAVGKPLPLSLTLDDGKILDLEKLHGKVVLLLFWDSSTRYSSKAIWAVNDLYKKYHASGLEVWGLNFDEDRAKAISMLKDANVEWPQYLDIPAGRTLQSRFGIHTLPMCWFVDKKGVLRELKGEMDPEGITKRLQAE